MAVDEESDKIPRCNYVIPRKNRKCRMMTKGVNRFCGEHAIYEESVTESSSRVVCPLDKKHTVHDHLENRCNSRVPDLPWIQLDFNKAAVDSDSTADTYWNSLSLVEKYEMFSSLRPRILGVFDEHKSIITHKFLTHDSMTKTIEECTGETKTKHFVQQSSIIGHISEAEFLDSSVQFIEFGAGKAQLTYQLVNAVQNPSSTFTVIDRAGCRQKFDTKAKFENLDRKVRRLRCDIEHLKLAQVEDLDLSGQLKTVGLCKHLCGAATDFAIKCVENSKMEFDALFLAPCMVLQKKIYNLFFPGCHHRCSLHLYTGAAFVNSALSLTSKEFPALIHMSTWATCGFGNESTTNHCPDDQEEKCVVCQFSTEDKLELGRKVKFLLEMGRKKYLESLGFHVQLLYYVDANVTPENILIVARRRIV